MPIVMPASAHSSTAMPNPGASSMRLRHAGGSASAPLDTASGAKTALQNVCLWCDEFFGQHYDIRKPGPR